MAKSLACPNCNAPLDGVRPGAIIQCSYCVTTIEVPQAPPAPDRLENLYSELNAIENSWSSTRAQFMDGDQEPAKPLASDPRIAIAIVLIVLLVVGASIATRTEPFMICFMSLFLLMMAFHRMPEKLAQYRRFKSEEESYLMRRAAAETRVQQRLAAARGQSGTATRTPPNASR